LIEASNSFKGYKVVDYEKLTALQESVSNRIQNLNSEIAASEKAMASQKEKIGNLKTELASMQNQLKEVSAEKDAITFLGFPFNKTSYKMVMWGIVALLIAALALFVVRFKKSHVHTREAKKDLAETEREFEAFRIKSLEKEQRLGRLLQDERNKLMKIAK
ncbi:MAG TPA: hypothetical protein VFI78_05110, partial [Salinimicrobium sp.]|nr:hypothetical protein [Salinimicrobium sp.]